MKFVFRISFLLLVTGLFLSSDALAQKKKKKGGKAPVAAAAAPTPAPTAPTPPPAPKYIYLPEDSVDYNGTGYNPLSVNKIHYSQVMYRMRIRRVIDLKEKCNTPFYNADYEITKYLLEAVKSGKLTAFDKDSVNKILPVSEVTAKLTYANELDTNIKESIMAKNLTEFQIWEDLLFDRQRSISTYDIQYIYLYIPAGVKPGQTFDDAIGLLRYRDVEKLFSSLPPKARWKNPFNNREDRTFTDAFRLRLFCGRIVQMAKDNARSEPISQLAEYSGNIKKQLIASQQFEYDIVSDENELYEY